MSYPRETIRDWFTRIDELLVMLIEQQKKTNELLKQLIEKGEAAPREVISVTPTPVISQPIYIIDLMSLIDKEYEFTIPLDVERNDEPLGIKRTLGGQTPFVTEFIITRLVGDPLDIKLNDTGSPKLTLKEGEGIEGAIIKELLISNTQQRTGTYAKIVVGWNSLIPRIFTGW